MVVYRFDSFGGLPVDVFVTTRRGGVSEPPYDTLNLGLRVGDSPEAVLQNRRQLFLESGLDLKRSVWCHQVHTGNVSVVDERDAGRGAITEDDIVTETDALVTAALDLPLCVTVADCVPVVIYDPDNHAVGLSHAGWGGTVSHITFNTVTSMVDRYGSRPEQLRAAIGPSISPDRYEVGPDVIARVAASFPDTGDRVLRSADGGKAFFDLWEANMIELTRAGVPQSKIEVAGISTIDRPSEFYSARSQRTTGRFIAAACLLPL
jgi:YfiH family protein